MIALHTSEDRAQFLELRSTSTSAGAGMMRYAAAMYFYQSRRLSDRVLEAYRCICKDDHADSVAVIAALGRANEIEEQFSP